jgi:hypothetical protein
MRPAVRNLVAALILAGSLAGCSLLPWASPMPVPVEQLPLDVQVPVPPELMRLEMNNGTDRPVMLSVNGGAGRSFGAGQVANLGVADLGPLPWHAVVRTVAGRQLLDLTVHEGNVWRSRNSDGSTSGGGAAAIADLSCGRIDLWSGQQPGGPVPGGGVPGDCDP